MSILLLILKVTVVVFFLIVFLRTIRITWAIGLLTVTSAILLDTFFGTFGREEMIAELGFFYYVIAGVLFAGASFWLWGLIRSMTRSFVSHDSNLTPTFTSEREAEFDSSVFNNSKQTEIDG